MTTRNPFPPTCTRGQIPNPQCLIARCNTTIKCAMTAQKESQVSKILLVDDVYMARSMAERVLTHVGRYKVHSVANGAEAIEAALADAPDLIILDISMAGMDGITALHELRERGVT